MKRINILVGGPEANWPEVLQTAPQSIPGDWLGVDRGTLRLLKLGLTPILAVGDFDSLDDAELKTIQQRVANIHYAKPEKDDTDSELGLSLAIKDLQADQIVLYGATGARIDHFLVNLFMVLEPRFISYAQQIFIIDRRNTIQFFRPGHHELVQESDKHYLAFTNLTPVTNFSIIDAKYRLNHVDLSYSQAFASNEFIDSTVHFEFDSGVICTVQSSD
ncbi:MAG: thiamine diphosphokinase [Lactobacillus sp.]|jgi:thiamine pyrophosphokinase|nr:thiamine diphosphokinase [Lactobacillus sp.]